jgi:hypothetical protein
MKTLETIKIMNLGKLLVAGKSIVGGRQGIAYRISDRAYLPKFISPRNPFMPPVKTEPGLPPVAVPVAKSLGSDGIKTRKLPTFPVARPRGAAWVSKLNPISIWRGSPPPAPRNVQPPLQPELSLDRVKVVHNDLSDVDVEVVPIKSRTAPETVEPLLTPASGGDTWSRLGAKYFGARAA